MLYYLFLPFLSILLVVLQTSIADLLFSGWLVIEISLIFVIYAGFRLDLVKGLISAFVLGFVFDCIAGSVLGLFTFIYTLIFLCSFFVSMRLVTEKLVFIAFFSFICALLEGLLVILLYNFIYSSDILKNLPFVYLPQALMIGLLAEVFFYMMRRVEGLFYGKTMQPAKWARAGGISAEA